MCLFGVLREDHMAFPAVELMTKEILEDLNIRRKAEKLVQVKIPYCCLESTFRLAFFEH